MAKRGAFVPVEDCGGYVIGTIAGVRVAMRQFCTVMVMKCRECGARLAKQQLAFRPESEPQLRARTAGPVWCFSCVRVKPCEHVWEGDVTDPDMDVCVKCGETTMPLGGDRASSTHSVAGDDSDDATSP